MRHIHKGTEPAPFASWRGALKGAIPTWNQFGDRFPQVKKDLKNALRREQLYVCCYCEREIATADSHVEHLVPKSVDASRTYDYANLLASCEGEKAKGRPPETCGHLKNDNPLPVHPLMPDCGDFFVFSSSGNVGPTSNAARQVAARDSIALLGLDSARLVALRRKVIGDMDTLLPSLGNGSPQEVAHFRAEVGKMIAQSSTPDALGRLTPFATALIQHLRRYL